LAGFAALFLMLASPADLHGACVKSNASRGGATPRLPAAAQSSGVGQGNRSSSIVGLWHVTYYFDDGSEMAQSFDQWFADGNEVEFADLGQGVACQGVWKQTAPGKIKLLHLGWSYDLVNVNFLIGSFTEEQLLSVSGDGNQYDGTYHFNFFDVNGNLVGDLSGTLRATRLAVQ
jgi:hypothetical protein